MGKSKYSNEVKQDTLAFGYYERVKSQIKAANLGDYEAHNSLTLEKRSNPYADCAYLLVKSQKGKRYRVHQKVRAMIESNEPKVFLTLTWNDERYKKLDTDKRRRLVQRWLKSNCVGDYMANLDINENVHEYADENGEVQTSQAREHYHCLVLGKIPYEALNEWYQKQGAYNIKEVPKGDEITISNYCIKLGLHALKSEALDKRLIFSRNTTQNE